MLGKVGVAQVRTLLFSSLALSRPSIVMGFCTIHPFVTIIKIGDSNKLEIFMSSYRFDYIVTTVTFHAHSTGVNAQLKLHLATVYFNFSSIASLIF